MHIVSRRRFAGLLVAAAAGRAWAGAGSAAGRALDFEIGGDFGGASAADIGAVLRSAAESIWRHCPATRWEGPGFHIYRTHDAPITLHERRPDGRIAIGLATEGTYWAQYAFQFAHEFGHALAGHSNDARLLAIRGPRPNHWLEESICETASLFALRAMSLAWRTQPPYPNWRSFASALSAYAEERLDASTAALAPGHRFAAWFRANEPGLRANATQREKNNLVALHVLPLFERAPSGWEAVTFYNRTASAPEQTLAERFADWVRDAPAAQRDFIRSLAALFEVTPAT
jgi:hypothetical protein